MENIHLKKNSTKFLWFAWKLTRDATNSPIFVWEQTNTYDSSWMTEYGLCMATLERGEVGGIRYVYGNVGESKKFRNMACVWQRWRGKKLEECDVLWQDRRRENLGKYGICMATLEGEKTGRIRYMSGNVRERKSWRNMVCIWQRWRGWKLEEYVMYMATLERGKTTGI